METWTPYAHDDEPRFCHCHDELEYFVVRGHGNVEDFGPVNYDPRCPLNHAETFTGRS